MKRLKIIDTGIMYVNGDPAHSHVFATHPWPRQLSEKEFLCVFQGGVGLYSADNRLRITRSTDGGVTWSEEGFLWDGSRDDRPYSYHGGYLTVLNDGSLVVLTFRADRSRSDRAMFSFAGGIIDNEPILFFSHDAGRTWSQPRSFKLPEGMIATPACPIRELEDGSWLATFDQWYGYDDPGPYRPCMWAFRSSDRGQSWKDAVVMADGRIGDKGFWHGKTIQLLDGRLYTMFWTADMTRPEQGPINLSLHCSFADGRARQWRKPESTNVPGQTNCPAQLPDGTFAVIFTVREAETPGFVAVLSEDGCNWDLENQVQVYDASGWTTIGINSPDTYPRSHDTIAYGAPTLMATTDGDLYASWWCTYASLTHLRWARLRVRA